jgi:MYXO-CTERM domain-containing protein
MYALQVTGARMWSMPFHTPLEAPILADGDNDALADVLAVGANHNVYALRHQHDPTAQVRDVALGEDGQLSDVGTDIDEQNHARGLAFAWEAVRNATIFRVAWMGDDGTLRPYQEIRGQQSFTVQGVELLSGVTYQAFVIARTNTGAISAPVASDGVRLVDQSPPTVTASLLTPARLSHALGGVTTLDVRASDDLGLKWIRVEALAQGADEPVWFSQIPARRAASWEGTPTWEGVDLGGMLVADGVWRLRVEAEDYSGRTASVELEVVLDGTGPTPPVLTAPALGAVLTEAQPRFEGTTDADVEVVVTVGARTCAATADGQGSFGCSLDELLEDGAHSAFAVARDDLGNPSPGASLEFSVDTTPPDAPTVVEPTEGEALVVGALTRFLVRADPEARVQVFLDGGETPICEATAPEGETDTFACSGPAPLELGAHQAYAVAFDDVGLASEPSGTVSFTIIEEEEPGNNGANNANNGANNANNGANNANNENNENNGANNDNNVNNTNNGANNANNADNNGGKNNENNGVNNATANNGTNNATNNGANNNANNNSGEPSTGGGATADEGCGCAVPASPRPAGGALGLGVAALALLWGARRRTR